MGHVIAGALLLLTFIFLYLWVKTWNKLTILKNKVQPIIDIEQEYTFRKSKCDKDLDEIRARNSLEEFKLGENLKAVKARLEKEMESVHANRVQEEAKLGVLKKQVEDDYREAVKVTEKLRLLQIDEDLIDCGFYKPHYKFNDSSEYKDKLDKTRAIQRDYIKSGNAAKCSENWTVGGSEKEGARMAKQNVKLSLRAFNGECEAAIANVTWNNIDKMEERIQKSFEMINELGKSMHTSITNDYINLKIEELRLTYEFEKKKFDEKEEQRHIREQMREEERALREAEKVKEEAEREERRYAHALDTARHEAATATGAAVGRLNDKIRELEGKLTEAQALKERAVSQAQLTKSGHVYIISNIGSFGDHVYKLGMTRRLDPMDRVHELGDASVPFPFDVHAMVYSDDAPGLENKLHQFFHQRRLNLVNHRKEFFKVTLEDIEKCILGMNLKINFTKLAEAREFRETRALFEKTNQGSSRTGMAG